jgi:hypothetical protein
MSGGVVTSDSIPNETGSMEPSHDLERRPSQSKVSTYPPADKSLEDPQQLVINPNVRYEDQSQYVEGGFGWIIVLCAYRLQLSKPGSYLIRADPMS